MFGTVLLKRVALVTLFFFIGFIATADFSFAQQEDTFEKVKKLVYNGEYEAAINVLNGYIKELQAIKQEKQNLAMAYYQLARIYYNVGETDEKINENLKMAFDSYPLLQVDEPNMAFNEWVEKFRKEQGIDEKIKTAGVTKEEPPREEKPQVIEKVKKKKKKKKFPLVLVVGGAAVVAVLVYLLTKKKKEKEYILTVTRGDGVEGTPAAGTYTYKEGTTVNYSFTQSSGYRDLNVTLDGTIVGVSGSS